MAKPDETKPAHAGALLTAVTPESARAIVAQLFAELSPAEVRKIVSIGVDETGELHVVSGSTHEIGSATGIAYDIAAARIALDSLHRGVIGFDDAAVRLRGLVANAQGARRTDSNPIPLLETRRLLGVVGEALDAGIITRRQSDELVPGMLDVEHARRLLHEVRRDPERAGDNARYLAQIESIAEILRGLRMELIGVRADVRPIFELRMTADVERDPQPFADRIRAERVLEGFLGIEVVVEFAD